MTVETMTREDKGRELHDRLDRLTKLAARAKVASKKAPTGAVRSHHGRRLDQFFKAADETFAEIRELRSGYIQALY